ncbi:MAG: transcription termination factor Rho [Candidatus Cloacimonetes bacterium 4572_65]|nr:MAG: transcription termination factor Rho [Candidatus Cloacimonetes bacterium 4572_65]
MCKTFSGYLVKRKPFSKIVTPDDINNRNPVMMSNKMLSRLKLEHGLRMTVEYSEVRGKKNVTKILSICGHEPEIYYNRKKLKETTVINPTEKFAFSDSKYTSLKVLDKFAPIGKGTRGLIVAPPRTGKTSLLKDLTLEVTEKNPDIFTLVLLVDERPEEITDFKRSTDAVVFASSNDENLGAHVFTTSLAMSIAKNEVESGNDVLLLIDSLTRISRVYNLNHKGTGKVMSGGISAGALDIPRKFFGMARNIEEGGSLTILATILVDTGSRMDQLIFEEFKGTGNCDIILDRDLAENRIFPAIDILHSGTRKDELFYTEDEFEKLNNFRRSLLKRDKTSALQTLINSVN